MRKTEEQRLLLFSSPKLRKNEGIYCQFCLVFKTCFSFSSRREGNLDTNQGNWQVLIYHRMMGSGVCHSEYLEMPAHPSMVGLTPSPTYITCAQGPLIHSGMKASML